MAELPNATMFEASADFRAWLDKNAKTERELWVGYWKKGSGRRGLTYEESVDEALCFGWIDGLTKTIDSERYATRFTPRRPTGNWSQANIKRIGELAAEGRMTPAGLKAFDEHKRRPQREGQYTYETRPPDLPPQYAEIFRTNNVAWQFWCAQRPSYRRSMTWWVVAAKREDTRLRRLEALIAESASGHLIDDLHLPKLAPPGSSNG